MKAYNFEDLLIWQLSRTLVKDIYVQFSPNRDRDFNSQIQRAAVSIMNNIAEGFERSKNSKDNKQLLNFLNISYGSCGEVRSMLYSAEDLGYISSESALSLRNRCVDLSIKMKTFIEKLRDYDNTQSPTRSHQQPAGLTNT
ncbi:MAG: four helix bundle protein [Paludibacteraceae bacterium]|nr:four helix bundle protein [Paludibacteraceae bacterium]